MKKWFLGIASLVVVIVVGLAVYGHLNPDKVYTFTRIKEREAAGLSEKTIRVSGIGMHYLEGGTGEPLVLVHGFGADKDNWTRVSKFLTPQFHVVAPDLPGFGDSDKLTDLDYSFSAQANRLHDFIQALNLGPVHLGGSSMGGAISGFYAALYPGEVKSLWLLDPGAVNTPEPSEYFKLLKAGGKNPLIIDTPEDIKDTLDFVFYKRPFIPPAIVTLLGKQAVANKSVKEIVFKAILNETGSIDTLLAGSDVPTLVMWGKNDRVLHVSGADVLCKAIPESMCVVMDETGHLPMIERPSQAAESFLAFQKTL